ncbi:MAG TPA: VOC family protein [Ignavibacteria bacterium]
MATKMFINLAVKDLKQTMDFFSKLGFLYNPQFTDDNAACMVINDDCSVMLLAEAFFKTFTKKELVDAHKSTEVLTAISADSKDKVNEILDKALAMGATEAREPQDLGFMYGRSFSDLDGHIWEIIWMDQSVMK